MRWSLVGVAIAVAGCYAPTYREGLTCAAGPDPCPPGQQCFGTTCWSQAPGDTRADADPDALAIDAIGVCGVGQWCEETGPVGELRAIWGLDADNIWVAGNLGIWRRTGGVWNRETSPGAPFNDIAGVSVPGGLARVFAVGDNGRRWEWTGTSWRDHADSLGLNYRAVTVPSPTLVYAVTNLRVRAYDGTNWIDAGFASSQGELRDIAATYANGTLDLYASGLNTNNQYGTIHRYDSSGGTGWILQPITTVTPPLDAIALTPGGGFFVGNDLVNGHIYKFDRQGLTLTEEATVPKAIVNVHSIGDDAWAVGRDGLVLHRDAAGSPLWSPTPGFPPANLRGVRVFPSRVWVVGDNGRVYRMDR